MFGESSGVSADTFLFSSRSLSIYPWLTVSFRAKIPSGCKAGKFALLVSRALVNRIYEARFPTYGADY